MFTWNFQYVSRARLAETFSQLMLDPKLGDVLIRIHTAIHNEEEAVELAKFIKNIVPDAHIFGTSTSAVILEGKMIPNQCAISVTQMLQGSVSTVMIPVFDESGEKTISPDTVCDKLVEAVEEQNPKLLLTFLTGDYMDVKKMVSKCNEVLPGVQMIGGLANTPRASLTTFLDSGFVFDEKGWSSKSMIVASISGGKLEAFSAHAAGIQAIGKDIGIDEFDENRILKLHGENAGKAFRNSVGEALRERPELATLFPYVYTEFPDVPFFVIPEEDYVYANHNIEKGKKIRRAFIYDRKIIADNRMLFRRVENFEKGETIFGYSCVGRAMLYPNSVKWELSAYENSNMCGCITDGEITCVEGKNTFANGSFVVSVMGEEPRIQRLNSFVFSHTDSLIADNQSLMSYMMEVEENLKEGSGVPVSKEQEDFVRICESNLMYSEDEDLPNAAALNMDMKINGYDRVCMIRVSDTSGMEAVFPSQIISVTNRNFVAKCAGCAGRKHYRIYLIDKWHLAIAAPSYMVKLSQFTKDMEALQNDLFSTSADYVAIVPAFCIIDNCTVENYSDAYYTARMEMAQKNIQFFVYDGGANSIDEDKIREHYHMVNVVNYAIAHDKIIPFYQGIHDNVQKRIHHYESLMRIMDEDGKIYYPGQFLDVARTYGLLYDSMSKIMIRKVFEKFRNYAAISVSINLGIRDIKNDEITEMIFEHLATVSHPENFVFEILENEDVEEYESLVSFVDKIHALGGKISIDDFGSGYSNLQHVLSIQADYLKLDGSIIRNCHVDKESENLVALMGAWKDVSTHELQIIAEFVENEEIQKKLIIYGIDYSQGYLFSKPAPEIGAVQ